MDIEALRNPDLHDGTVTFFLDRAVLEIQKQIAWSHFSTSAHDIARLAALQDTALNAVQHGFGRIIEEAETRRRNLEIYPARYKIISLGEDCFSRSIATRWGFKPAAILGESSHPFDLAVHPIQSIPVIINAGFAEYTNPAQLVFSAAENVVRHRLYGICFNHEPGIEYAENDFAKLRGIYDRRVANFRADLASCRNAVLLCHIQNPARNPDGVNKALEDVWTAMTSSWPGRIMRMISINTWPCGMDIPPQAQSPRPGVIDVINVHYPVLDYVWHNPESFMTPSGFTFEKHVAAEMGRLLG